MHTDRSRLRGIKRYPLSPLHSNTLDPLAPRSGAKVQTGGRKPEHRAGSMAPQQGSGQQHSSLKTHQPSRIPTPPTSKADAVQRPGSATASKIPRGPEHGAPGHAGISPQPASGAAALPMMQPVWVSSHINPAFDGDQGECACLEDELDAASPALSYRTDVSRHDLCPGMLDQTIYTPATARGIQAWLHSSTPTRGGEGAAAQLGRAAQTPLMPTPEAWRILQHMHQPPSPGAPQDGVFNIMNVYLRTGAQMLSPEPGCEGGSVIPAPAYMAEVVNRGNVLRPAASPGSDPGSVRSSSVSSCNAAPPAGQGQHAQPARPPAEEAHCIVLAPPVHGHDNMVDVPNVGPSEAAAGKRSGPPSPISFNLPADSPDASPSHSCSSGDSPKSGSPTFSFGIGANQAAPGPEPPAELPDMPRLDSNTSVEQPNPFKAMLCHLRGPQYASPAPLFLTRPASPKSPDECKPLVLLPNEAAVHQQAAAATPELGKGSLTHWIDRRGLSQALNTPARLDLQLLWDAMRDNQHVRSEADEVRHENAALERELELVQAMLRELGVEYRAAVEAAEANQVYAEAEIARARVAAQQMMELSNQIQQMFNLCEAEKAELMGELAAAQQRLAETEAGAANHSDLERSELEKPIQNAREAVAAAQRAADEAEARANDACGELLGIKAELQATQQQLAGAQASVQPTPMAALRTRLQGMQDALAGLHDKQTATLPSPGLDAKRVSELQQLLAQSKQQLGSVQALLDGEDDMVILNTENQTLKSQLQEARALLVAHTPASAQQERDAEMHALFGSPTPLRLSAEFGLVSDASDQAASVASGSCIISGSCGLSSPAISDLFSSPYMASQATLTVDYRELHGAVLADCATSRAFTPSLSAETSEDLVEFGSPSVGLTDQAEELQGYTVVHNRLIVTNVPASEVSKVKSMVQYWEGVACGTVLPCEGEEEAEQVDDAPAHAIELGSTALEVVVEEQGAPAAEDELLSANPSAAPHPADEGANELAAPAAEDGPPPMPSDDLEVPPQPASVVEEVVQEVMSVPAEPIPQHASEEHAELQSHPLETPFTIIAASWTPGSATASAARSVSGAAALPSPAMLPEGPAATPAPAAAEVAALAATPVRRFTPLNFVAEVPPTPASTPAAAANSAPAVQAEPAGAAASTPSSINITPLSLSALRRAGSSDMQAAVRHRLQRLKMDLQKAQAKLQNVDQGLAAIAVSPASSLAYSLSSTPTADRKSPSTPTTTHKTTPFRSAGSEPASPTSAAAVVAVVAAPAATIPQPAAEAPEDAPTACAEMAPVAAEVEEAENRDVNALAATPPNHKAGVRFAEGTATSSCHSSSKPALRAGASSAAALPGYVSPGAVSAMRRTSPGSAAHRMSPAVLRSANKGAPSPLRLAALDSESDSDSSSTSDSSDDEDMFDRSRMAIQAMAATPKTSRTPLAHPEGAGSTPQSVAFSSTSSFTPPEPLAFIAIKPFNRARRAPAGMAGGRRRPSETEEREFRRRAAALKIQISPYFKRR